MSDDMKPNPLQNLKAVAHMAEGSGLHIDDLRVMPAAGVADIVYEAKDLIEELEERLKAAIDDAKEAEAYAEELEAKLAKAEADHNEPALTLDIDEYGIWLIEEAPHGEKIVTTKQLGHVSWKQVATYVQKPLAELMEAYDD